MTGLAEKKLDYKQNGLRPGLQLEKRNISWSIGKWSHGEKNNTYYFSIIIHASPKFSLKNIEINKELFDQINLDPGGVVITARGSESDFVSRYFVPQCSFFEDPVTGSTHCSLVPYWSGVLKKTKLKSIQLSERGGEMFCEDLGNRVIINGKAKTYFKGKVTL